MSGNEYQRVMLTASLRTAMQQYKGDDRVVSLVGQMLDKGIEYIKNMPRGDARIKQLYSDIDKTIKTTIEENSNNKDFPSISCTKGCAHCCHLYVMCSHEEADLIYKEAKKRNIPMSRKRLEFQARFKNHEYYFTRFGKRTRCVFLNDKNECQIYQYRPINCRKYYVGSPPEMCLPDAEGKFQAVGSLFIHPVEILASAHMNMDLMDGLSKEGDNFSLSARLLERIKKNG